MRLLNARTYELQTFLGKDKPNYAILSHTWEDGEILFEDIRDRPKIDWSAKKGYFKIRETCEQALKDGCDFVWIDTCNINKDSSTELSEAINSMFRWYENAKICYAYISDKQTGDRRSLSECRWFTRGWTLQEMIAPDRVHFYDRNWTFLGSRISLARRLQEASGVHETLLLRSFHHSRVKTHVTKHDEASVATKTAKDCECCPSTRIEYVRSMLDRFSVAQKMKWASKRITTREEDVAYCLMGLFDVNMPLLYGEGTRAFFRLQKAILEMQSDHSILAYRLSSPDAIIADGSHFLAPNPTAFRDDFRSIHIPDRGTHSSLTGNTLSIDMLVCPVQERMKPRGVYLGILDCSMNGDPHMIPAILLSVVHKSRAIFRCISKENLFLLHSNHPGEAKAMMNSIRDPDPIVFTYRSRDIKRARISIIGENAVMPAGHHTIAYARIYVSPVFHDLKYQYTSLPPLEADNLLDTTSRHGSIEFSHEVAEGFSVNWNQGTSGQLRCSITSDLESVYKNVIQEQGDPNMDPDLESIDRHANTPHMDLGDSEIIVLKGAGNFSLEVWISMSREVFIGRSRLVLSVHGNIVSLESDKKENTGLIPRLRVVKSILGTKYHGSRSTM